MGGGQSRLPELRNIHLVGQRGREGRVLLSQSASPARFHTYIEANLKVCGFHIGSPVPRVEFSLALDSHRILVG